MLWYLWCPLVNCGILHLCVPMACSRHVLFGKFPISFVLVYSLSRFLWKNGSLSVAWLFAPEIKFVNCLGKALEACAGAEIFLEALGASDPII